MNTNLRTSTGEVITFELEGVERVQEDLNSISADLQAKYAPIMMADVGDAVKYWMQQNILAQRLLKTGALFNSVFATVLSNDEGADVYVGPDVNAVPYAMIQNYGGVVPAHWVAPVEKQALHWIQGGEDRFSRGHMVGIKTPIIIQPRPYIEPAFDDHQEEILEIMNRAMDEAIGEEIATSGASSW